MEDIEYYQQVQEGQRRQMAVSSESPSQSPERKLRRVASPRKSFSSLLSAGSSSGSGHPLSPTSSAASLDSLLREGREATSTVPPKHPRRTVTPSPFRFALTSCRDLFNPSSKHSPPASPTRIHKPAYAATIPNDLSIPPTPKIPAEFLPTSAIPVEDAGPRLTPFDIPHILEQIISYVDEDNVVPSEPAPVRRKPLSYQHALLIYYPDVARAKEAWAQACRPSTEDYPTYTHHSGVYACLLVNKEWHISALRVLRRRAFFTSYDTWKSFAIRKQGHTPHLRTLVLHKVRQAQDSELQLLGTQPHLEWLELHVCPDLLPDEKLLCSSRLRRIALPGCSKVDDSTLELIGRNCPNLEILDLRACENVTDKGILAVAEGCPKLKYLNVGRVKGGEKITCDGVDAIARLTDVDTLGLAGCSVGDRGIWSVATNRGPKIERLSLNNCVLLSNASIPLILPSTPNLQVLELRGCVKITHVRPIVEFRRKWRVRGVLIEGCEVFEGRMRRGEEELEAEARGENIERGNNESMVIDS